MGLGNVLVNAIDTALQDREVAFDGIGRNGAANKFFCGMVDGLVRRKVPSDRAVNARFVGAKVAFARSMALKNGVKIVRGDVWNVERANAPFAFDKRKDRLLRSGAGKLLGCIAANIGLVGF